MGARTRRAALAALLLAVLLGGLLALLASARPVALPGDGHGVHVTKAFAKPATSASIRVAGHLPGPVSDLPVAPVLVALAFAAWAYALTVRRRPYSRRVTFSCRAPPAAVHLG